MDRSGMETAPGERARWEQAQVDREVRRSERLLRREAWRLARVRAAEARAREDERRWLRDEVEGMLRGGWRGEELARLGMGPELLAELGLDAVDEPGGAMAAGG